MALTPKQRKDYATEMIDFVYLGIRGGIRFSVYNFRRTKNINDLMRAIELPNRAKARINTFLAKENENANELASLTAIGRPWNQIQSDMDAMDALAQQLLDDYLAGNLTADEIADSLDNEYGAYPTGSLLPIPSGYKSIVEIAQGGS